MSGETRPPRWLPDEPWPAYTHVPGRTPHPFSEPAGHSYGHQHAKSVSLAPWTACRPYLRGLDLFNYGYYWEAHESWEQVWHAAGRRGATANFLKALIHLAAAGVKLAEGRDAGVAGHLNRAMELLGSPELPDHMLGFDLTALRQTVATRAATPSVSGDDLGLRLVARP